MKALKYAGIAFGIIAILIVGGIAFVASQFDADRIKSELARVVQEKKQRTLKIDGALELSFWPNVGVRLGKLSLSEHASAQTFAAVESARVSVAVLPLLSKRIVVNAVEVDGVKAALVKHKDGTLNIDDLISKDKTESQPVQLDVAAIKVGNVRLTWQDEKSGSTTTISGLDLSTGRVQADTGKQVFQVDALALAVKGKIDADDRRESPGDSFDIRLDAPKLAVTPEKSGGETITLAAVVAGAQRNINAKLTLSGVEGTAQAFKVAKLAFSLDARAGETAVKGGFDSALAADPGRQTVALEKFAGSFDIANPQMPMKQVKLPITGALHADLATQSAAGHLATQFDESKIALKFDVAKFAPLALGFDLDIDRLNVDKYLPPKKAGESGGKGGDGKLDLSALKGLNANGTVKIGSLQVANIKAANVRLQIRAANGRLDIAPHSASLYNGTLNGGLSLDANGNAVAAKENLAGISINPLMKDAVDKDLLEGRGSVTLDVTARGETVAAMKKALGGSASLALKDGAIKGINLAQSFRELKSKFSGRQDAVQQAKQTDKTDFSELSASFRIAGGVAHNEDLAAKSPFLRLAGAGDIDIGNNAMNYLAKASIVATAGGQGAKDLDYLKGVTVPVRASGPFDNLSYRIEFAGLASEAVKAKVEEKTQAVQQQAKDKLKGLFGR